MWKFNHIDDWAPKNWSFQIVVLRKTLESPLDCKEIKTANPKETDPEYSLEGLMLNLKLHYFDHMMWRDNALKKLLILGRIEGRRIRSKRRWDGWLHHWFNRHELGQTPGDREGHAVVHGVRKSWTWLVHWTTANGDNACGFGFKFVHCLFFA